MKSIPGRCSGLKIVELLANNHLIPMWGPKRVGGSVWREVSTSEQQLGSPWGATPKKQHRKITRTSGSMPS